MPQRGQRAVKYIYGLVDPRDHRVRYVGQTNDLAERHRWHSRYDSAHGREAHKPIGRWKQTLLAEQLPPQIIVLETVPWAEADEAERRWVAFGARLGWQLFNVTINPRQLDLLADEQLRCANLAH